MCRYHHIIGIILPAITMIALVPCLSTAAIHEGSGFDRYRVILKRKPFGEVLPSDVAVTPPGESFAKDLEMRAIIDDGHEILVGFLDKKNNENIYLRVGETINGIELISVDYENEEATLRKGLETSVFSLKPNKKPRTKKTSPPKKISKVRRRPIFTKLKKKKAASLQQDEPKTPFRGETIENFLKQHPEAALQYPSPLRPPDPTLITTPGKGETIERFLMENPDAVLRFSPIQAPDIMVPMDDKGETIERFLQEYSDEMLYIQPPTPIPFPSMDESIETYIE